MLGKWLNIQHVVRGLKKNSNSGLKYIGVIYTGAFLRNMVNALILAKVGLDCEL